MPFYIPLRKAGDPLRPRALTVTARYVNPDWGFIAARNLSEWRSSLLQRTPKIQVPDSWEFWDNYRYRWLAVKLVQYI